MKTLNAFSIAVVMFCFGTNIINAQNLDRVALSSGGISTDTINATIGEIFVFSVSNTGINIDAGSQSDQGNTGGITTNVSFNAKSQSDILIYPNPVDDFVNLKINGLKSEIIAFQVFDVAGKLVLNLNSIGKNSLFRINVNSLSKGNYFIIGYSSQGESVGQIKFVKL